MIPGRKVCGGWFLFVLLLVLRLALEPAAAAEQGRGRFRTDRVIILPKPTGNLQTLADRHLASGRRMVRAFPRLGGLQVVELAPGETVAKALGDYLASGMVLFAEPDFTLRAAVTPDDPSFRDGTQWSLRNLSNSARDISAELGWETLHSASNIIVAVVDSGIRYTHQDLADNMWSNPGEIPANGVDDDRNGVVDDLYGLDAVTNQGDPMDQSGHGTHVAGIIGAVGNNGRGITGVAWKVQLMACRFLNESGEGDTSDALQCIDYARRMGASIINASFGGEDYSAALYTALASARAAGIVVVAAAGNGAIDLDQTPLYPASYNLDNIVVVGATSRADVLDTGYSNFGASSVDLCAPGTGIYSTWSNSDSSYQLVSGTSMAAPHVAGALALMRARFTNLTSSQLIARLLASVDLLPSLAGQCRTGGRINLAKAIGPDPAASFALSVFAGSPPLAVSFTNLSLGDIASWEWDFGDGSLTETNLNPSHVFGRAGDFPVELTVIGRNGRTNSFRQTVSVRSSYEIVPEPFAWIDPAGMNTLALADNGASEQSLPFPFDFYQRTRRSVFVGANGLLAFDSGAISLTDNTSLPNTSAPNEIICPYWDNLNPEGGGTVYADTFGEAPARRFVVTWEDIPRNSTATRLTFQAILEERTREIVFQYLDVQPGATRGGGRRATVGVEDETGTMGALYTFNGSPRIIANQSALRIRPKPFRFLAASTPALRFVGVRGIGFARPALDLTLENTGSLPLEWAATTDSAWFKLETPGGTLPGRSVTNITVTLLEASQALPAGLRFDRITLTNRTDGQGVASIPVTLEVQEPIARLAIENAAGTQFSGGLGGPFSPSHLTLELVNSGNIPVEWFSFAGEALVELLPASGTLAPEKSVVVEIFPGAGAALLSSGTRELSIGFGTSAEGPAAVHHLISVAVNTRVEGAAASLVDGKFRGQLALPALGAYQIEYSDDLAVWLPLETGSTATRGVVTFDQSIEAAARRFYRLRML